jgi:DNA-binding beta-propeller fold protein YncE
MKIPLMLVAAMMGVGSAAAQQSQPLTLVQTLLLQGVTGKFDHFAIDLTGKRLFAAATGNHSVEVIDLTTGKVEQSILGLGKPHGLVWDDSTQKLYVADGMLAELLVYKSSPNLQLTLAGKLKLSDDADDMIYNQTDHLLFVGHGGSDAANPPRIAVVDTDNFHLKADIPVAAHPEALDIDLQSQRIFANIADSSEIALLDGNGKAKTGTWKLANASHNVPLAYDAEDHLLYVACRAPATLLALDGSTGKEMSRIPTGEGADDLFYDPGSRRVYVISGAGEVDVYQADSNSAFHSLGVIQTAAGAKTALFVPSQSRLYVGLPGADGKPAEIRIYSSASKRGGE